MVEYPELEGKIYNELKSVAHELAHALAVKPPKGFRSDYEAVASAFREFKKTHPRASAKSFAANVSNYATTSYGEAFQRLSWTFPLTGRKQTLLVNPFWNIGRVDESNAKKRIY